MTVMKDRFDCTKCYHRKMCTKKINTCDFVDENKVKEGLRIVEDIQNNLTEEGVKKQ